MKKLSQFFVLATALITCSVLVPTPMFAYSLNGDGGGHVGGGLIINTHYSCILGDGGVTAGGFADDGGGHGSAGIEEGGATAGGFADGGSGHGSGGVLVEGEASAGGFADGSDGHSSGGRITEGGDGAGI